MSGYCTADDVCSSFPFFQRSATASISDAQIEGWIEDRKVRIRSMLLTRGVDPDAPAVTGDAARFLHSLNLDGAIADMGDALAGTATLQPGEYSLPAERRRTFERVLKEIKDGFHDQLFQPVVSRTADVSPMFQGVGGAETDPINRTPLRTQGNNRFFSRNQEF